MSPSPTLREINENNCLFWEEQNALRNLRIADEAIRGTAFSRLSSEQERGIPAYYQTPIEKLLADAEGDKQRFLSHQARKGGRAKKSDALGQLIFDLVQRDPHITVPKVGGMLTTERFPDLIKDVDEDTIWFVQPNGSKDGRLKGASISGLKDRLSRAKKSLKSR